MRGVGFRFRPKIEFLIKLLQFKAAGGGDISGCTEVPGDVADFNMYGPAGKEPWKLFTGEHEIYELHDVNKKTIKEKYVLTKLTKIGKKNVARTAGAGTWDDQATAKPVVIGGQEMGHWRTLTYEYWGGDGAEADKCYYYMNELHLSEHALAEARSWNAGKTLEEVPYYVICRVLKNEAKNCRNRSGGKKRSVCTENSAGQDCPNPKKNRGNENNNNVINSSSSTSVNPQLYYNQEFEENINGGYVNEANYFYAGLDQSTVPVCYSNVVGVAHNQAHQNPAGYYSALLQSRDYPELDNRGNWDPGCSSSSSSVPAEDQDVLIDNSEWQQYMSSGFTNLEKDREIGLA